MNISISKLGLILALLGLFLAVASLGLNVPTVFFFLGSVLYLFFS